MKKKINRLYGIFWAVMAVYLFLAFSSNPPNGSQGYTGAPTNMNTCSSSQGGCHSGGTGTGNVMITGMPATISPSTVYPITVSVNRTNNTPQRGGFQLTVLDASNNFVGTLSNPGASSTTQTAGSRTLFEHNPALTFAGNTVSYTIDWTSPATGSGAITMYAAALLANGNGGTSGDPTVTTNSAGTFMGVDPIDVTVTGVNVDCFGESTGSATANPSGGGGGPYFYAWSNGGTMQTINNLMAGTYTVTVTNTSGGEGTGSIMITEPPSAVSVSIVSQTDITCVTPIATATAQGSGGTPGYTYSWSNGESGPTASFTTGGNYIVTVSDANTCMSTASVFIIENNIPPIAEAGPPAELDCTNSTVMLNGSGSSTGSGITYFWTTLDGIIISGENTLFPEVGAEGTYTLTVTNNDNGCTAVDNTTVTGNSDVPTADAGDAMELTCDFSSVLLDGTGSSGGSNISYLWTTVDGNIVSGETTTTPEVNAAGTYTLTVTNDDNGCTATDDVTVTSNTMMPNSDAGDNMTLTCTNTEVTLDGSASETGTDITYLWSTADGNIVSGETTTTPTVNAPGTYCLEVTNQSNGCTATDCATVIEDSNLPVADAGSASPITCTTNSITLDGSASSSGPSFSYLWTTTDGNIVSGETTTMPTVNQVGTYTIVVTNDDNGCSSVDDVTVTEDTTPPVAEAGPDMALNCNNTSVVLDGSGSSQGGNISYDWSGPGIQSGGNTPSPTVNEAGEYSIIVTNENTGCSATDNVIVTETPVLTASIPTQVNVACNGDATGSATAEGSGGDGAYSYAWSNGGDMQTISDLTANTYSVTISDGDDCTATASVTITQPTELMANASATAESFMGAMDGTATANPSGGVMTYTYAWSNGETTQSIMGLSAGNYTVTVTDANQCQVVETVTVANFNCSSFTLSFSQNDPLCNGGNDGTATANPSSGTEPYTYNWSNGGMEATATNLGAGTYTVTVTDGNDCELTGNVTLGEPPALGLTTTQTTNVLCNGENTGSATLVASGGTPTYTYQWPDGGSGPDRNDLAAGTYAVTATDASQCMTTTQFTITEPPLLMANVTSTDETSVGAQDGTASVPTPGGTAPYTFLWNTGETAVTITNLAPGEYCVTVTDANNCEAIGCNTVNAFGCNGASAMIEGVNVSCFGGNNGTASVTAEGLVEPLTYAWSNGATGANIGMLTADVYTVSVSDVNGCSTVEMIEITAPEELVVAVLDVINLTCPGDMNGEITVQGEGGTPDYAYSWPNGSTMETVEGLADGFYEVSLSDDNGCQTVSEIEVGIDPDTEFPVVVTQNITVSLDGNGMATITAAQVDGGSTDNCGVAALVIDISEFTCDDIGENEVVLAVADAANNCAFDMATVTVEDNLPPVITCPSDIEVNDGSCQAVVDYIDPTAEDNCGNVTVMLESGLASGSTFPSGITEVAWTADDGNGQEHSCTFSVTVVNDFSATATSTSTTCNGDADGTATATPAGGASPFSYLWNDPLGQETATASDLPANTYSCTVTDADGCSTVATVEVVEPLALDVTVDAVINEMASNMDGAIEVTVSNGEGTLTYEWFLNGTVVSMDEDPTGLSGGEYTMVATDANGCTVETTVTVDIVNSAFDAELAGFISVFPNPASGQMNVRFELPQTMEVQLSLLDLTGRAALPKVGETLSERTLNFDVNELAAGVYFLRIVVDGSVLVRRVIVQ